MTSSNSIEKMTFEEALQELTELVKKLDSDQESLSEAISAFERGIELKTYCEKRLQEARLKVEKIITESDGKLSTTEIS